VEKKLVEAGMRLRLVAKYSYLPVKFTFNNKDLKPIKPFCVRYLESIEWHKFATSAAKARNLEIRSATLTT